MKPDPKQIPDSTSDVKFKRQVCAVVGQILLRSEKIRHFSPLKTNNSAQLRTNAKKVEFKTPQMSISFMKWTPGFFGGQKKLSGSLSMMTRPVKIMQGRIFKFNV